MLKRILLITPLFTVLSLTSCGNPSHHSSMTALNSSDDMGDALSKISAEIAAIQLTVKINDEARLQVLNRSVTAASMLVREKGLAHIKTINSLRKMVMYFIYSEQFFQFIRTETNTELVDQVLLKTIAIQPGSIRSDIGYDDDPLGTILADNLDVMAQRVNELMASAELPDDVRTSLRPLIARIGFVKGLAEGQGDRPVPYREGQKLCSEIDRIYPLLDQLNGSSQFFQKAQDIRGTNEFLKDFLQVKQQETN